MTLTEALATVLSERRTVHKLKLREVSQRSGLSLGYISGLEKGKNTPSLTTIHKLVTVYELPLSAFFSAVEALLETKT